MAQAGEGDAAPQPWSGTSVIEVGGTVTVAAATKRFADFGAGVVKVEPIGGGEVRRLPPFPDDRPHLDRGGFHLALDTGKRSIVVDLGTASGREVLGRLAADADLAFVDLPPADAERVLATLERASRASVVAVTPHGLDGPYAGRRESDLTLFGWSTRPYRHSIQGREPLRYAPFAGSAQVGATAAAVGAAALRGARGGGERRVADVAGVEALLGNVDTAFFPWALTGSVQPRRPGQSRMAYPTGAYRCRDGYVVISGRHEPAFSNLFRLLGRADLADDPRFRDPASAPRHFDEFVGLFQPWLDARTRYEAFEQLQAIGMMVAPLLDVSEAADDPQAKARGSYETLDVPGVGSLTLPGPPFRIEDDGAGDAWALRAAPRLGEHTGEVLDELGYGRDEQIALFRAVVTR